MSQHISLSDHLSLLNEQTTSQAHLSEYLFQVSALFEIVLNTHFLYLKKATVHYYLSVLNDIVSEAKDFSEQRLNHLINLTSNLKITPPFSGEAVH